MRYVIIITISCLLLASCKKDQSARPILSFKSVNSSTLHSGDRLIFTLSYKDVSGSADSLFVKSVVLNCANDSFTDKLELPVYPSFPGATGDILVAYGYNQADNVIHLLKGPQCGISDTCYFRFVLKDKAGNLSDTINSGTIVLIL